MSIPNEKEIEAMERKLLDEVENLGYIVGVHGLECPNCGADMRWDADWMEEEYDEGWFRHSETYTCPDCDMFVNLTDNYRFHHVSVTVRTDDMEEEA